MMYVGGISKQYTTKSMDVGHPQCRARDSYYKKKMWVYGHP